MKRESQKNTDRPGSRKEYANAAKLPIEDVQFPLSEPEGVEMQIEHKILRLIKRNLILQLLHYNMNSSTDSSQFSGYEHTIMVNLKSNDTTLQGGIMTQEIRPVSPNHSGLLNV